MPKVPPEIFRYIHRKKLVLESLFNKVAGFLVHSCFYVNITEFLKHLQTAVSVHALILVISFLFCNQGITEFLADLKPGSSAESFIFVLHWPFLLRIEAVSMRPATLLKERLWHRYFPVSFAKFSRTSFFTEYL